MVSYITNVCIFWFFKNVEAKLKNYNYIDTELSANFYRDGQARNVPHDFGQFLPSEEHASDTDGLAMCDFLLVLHTVHTNQKS